MKLATRKITNAIYDKLKFEYDKYNMYQHPCQYFDFGIYEYFPYNISHIIINVLYSILSKYDNRVISNDVTPIETLHCYYFRIRNIKNE